MKFKHVCLIFVVMLFISMTGVVSAANETDDNLGKEIFNKEEVAKEALVVWGAVNESGNIGTKLIAASVLIWIVTILAMAFIGAMYLYTGDKDGNENKTNKGTRLLKVTVLALVAPIVIIALLIMAIGLIL